MWLNRRALRLHITLVVVFPACLLLGWWQLNVALSGNTLSWVYTFEWPMFAVYAVYMWWRLLHDDRNEDAADEAPEPTPTLQELNPLQSAIDVTGANEQHGIEGRLANTGSTHKEPNLPEIAHDNANYEDIYEKIYGDDELSAYNRYLAELSK